MKPTFAAAVMSAAGLLLLAVRVVCGISDSIDRAVSWVGPR